MKLLLIRHAEPDYTRDSLTPKGCREAELLAKRLCRLPIDDFFVSPLGRARDTARATLETLHRTAEVLPWLEEFRGQIYNPKTAQRCHCWDLAPQYWTRCPELYDRDHWRENALLATGNAGEIFDETAAGLDALLARYGYTRDGAIYRTEANSDKTLALICHFGISMVMLAHLTNVSPIPLLHNFMAAPTSITVLCTEERVPGEVVFRCAVLGDTAHLYCAGEPISHSGRFPERYGADNAPDVL